MNKKTFLTATIIALIIYSSFAYLALTNRPAEEFFELGLLNKDKIASEYFPKNNDTLIKNTTIIWYLYSTSFFRIPQLIKIIVKLGNNETRIPDSNGTPSNALELYSWYSFMNYNKTKYFLFEWKILDVKEINGRLYITLNLNNTTTMTPSLGIAKGEKFRMIFELYTYDTASNQFILGWNFQGERKVLWLQIWFSVKLE